MATTAGASFASTHRMVDWIHRYAADVRPATKPALLPRFAQFHVGMVRVADLPDRRAIGDVDETNLSGRQTQGRILAITCHQLS